MSRSHPKDKVAKKPLPEYRPRCFRNLQELLGLSDATVEWIEVAVRELKHVHEVGGAEKASALATQHGIKVNRIDFDSLPPRWASLQVLSVYQILEWFLVEFRQEHPRKVRGKKDDEDLLSYTLSAFAVSKHKAGMLEFEILDYYRLARNHLMHNPAEPQAKTHITQCERIEELMDNTPYSKLRAPNKLIALGFDDFILFSRALKNLARALCAETCPTAEEFAALLDKDDTLRKVLRGTNQNRDRVHNKLESYLRRRYGLPSCAESLSTAILSLSPLAQW
jgi:hypothetical protein